MRTALIEIEADSDGDGHPRNYDDYTYPREDVVEQWLYQLEGWGITRIIFVGDDVLIHPDWWKLCDYASNHRFRDIYAFTNGMFLTREGIREFAMRDVTPVVPLDFTDPVTGRIYGDQDYNPEAQNAAQRLRNAEIWQGVTEDNLREVEQILQLSVQAQIPWEGHVEIGEEPPDDLIQQVQATEHLDIVTIEEWFFAHHDVHVPEVPYFQSRLLRGRDPYTGTLRVATDGTLSSVHTHGDRHVLSYSRSDLKSFALENEISTGENPPIVSNR